MRTGKDGWVILVVALVIFFGVREYFVSDAAMRNDGHESAPVGGNRKPKPVVTADEVEATILAATDPARPRPWSPRKKTKLPPEFVKVVRVLLSHGLPDPRGTVLYRARVTVAVPGSKAGPIEAVGWMLPERKGLPPMLLLPSGVTAVVEKNLGKATPADLKAIKFPQSPYDSQLVFASLLAISGDETAAMSALNSNPFTVLSTAAALDAYLIPSVEQAVFAHHRRHYALALEICARINRYRRDLVSAGPMPRSAVIFQSENRPTWRPRPYGYLDRIHLMDRDCEKRLRDSISPQTLPSDKLQAQLALLPELGASQMEVNSTLSLKPFSSLEARAVPALLDLAEHSDGLTLAMRPANDAYPGLEPISVREAARLVLEEMLGLYERRDAKGNEYPVERLAALAQSVADLPREQKWLKVILADDSGPYRVGEAAFYLTDPSSRTRTGIGSFSGGQAGDVPYLAKLSAEDRAQLARIAPKRIAEALAEAPKPTQADASLLRATLALGRVSLMADPTLRKTARMALDAVAERLPADAVSLDFYLRDPIVDLTADLIRSGDPTAIRGLGKWLERTPTRSTWAYKEALMVYQEFATLPEVQKEAARLFGPRAKYPFNRLMGSPKYYLSGLDARRLSRIPAFREGIMTSLRDQTQVATMTMRGSELSIDIGDSGHLGLAMAWTDSANLPSQPMRACDACMLTLVQPNSAQEPLFNPYWPLPRRNAAISEMMKTIQSG